MFAGSFGCMAGMRASEFTNKTFNLDARTLHLENVHFFHSTCDFKQDMSDPALQKALEGIDSFCIPKVENRSVLELSENLKNFELVWSFDCQSMSLDNFRGMFVNESDFPRLGRQIELKRPNRIALQLRESKVGPVTVWLSENPYKECPICPVRSILEILAIRDRLGESWSRKSLLFTIKTDQTKDNSPLTKDHLSQMLKCFAKTNGVSKMATHSCRKDMIATSCNSGIEQGAMKMLARLSLGTLDHYMSCLPDTIAYYHCRMFKWLDSTYKSVSNGAAVIYDSYL